MAGRGWDDWERRGTIVTPLWPPTTGTATDFERLRSPRISATNVEARTTSRVVTPNSLRVMVRKN